jgi:hypothetical protein
MSTRHCLPDNAGGLLATGQGRYHVDMTTTTLPNLAAASPVEIDTELVRLAIDYARAQAIRDSDSDRVDDGQRSEAATAMYVLATEMDRLSNEYNRRPWRRWYWVPGGHAHDGGERDDNRCRTLYQSTVTNLDPRLSGSDLAAAVTRYGWHVCTVCAPDAPMQPGYRTAGTRLAEQAAQDGTCLNITPTWKEGRRGRYAVCASCGETYVTVTSLGRIRKHVNREWKDAQDRTARLTDPKLIGTETGEELRVAGEVLRTVIAARNAWYRHAGWVDYTERYGRDNPAFKAEHQGYADQVAAALARKAGQTVEAWKAEMEPKLKVKLEREARAAAKHR